MCLVFACIAQSDKTLNVTITADPPVDSTHCEDEIVMLMCQVPDVTQPSYKWSSNKYNITEQTNSIRIVTTTITVKYNCTVFDAATNRTGEGNIIVPNSSKLHIIEFIVC